MRTGFTFKIIKIKQIRKIKVLTDWGAIAKKSKCLNRDFYDSMINEIRMC
jgi:hypothetical protein